VPVVVCALVVVAAGLGESLAEDFRAGASREELVDLYDLTPAQVDQALRFELIAGSDRAA